VKFLTDLFRHSDTHTSNTHPVTDAPHMDATSKPGATRFQPVRVTVDHRNGRFERMEIAGPVVGGPDGYHAIRRLTREQDVPEWARGYLTDNN
jgi:hypothetical protein